ncbi:Lactose phosphotransferase system repressor [Anaerococcus prevotii]|uniref:Lactose phosphotransferase system repressor n=1 Tax=Anaerococcus prevotii (strain ATCC 9321 / DSM 20548 / JCM 6508 / NCTC 11806 / PC1) TaxID=525919 RepID=C7RF66_ANAPD|nr:MULTISPECIES: DeoR/GlpR family DNA-binding transcription regulator [Anaerococcus]ACV28127.1 transcriptional regulator, DeoR family [Anaerococcus prevotii DSM 20548]SUU93678.1 Lactose phosphotransferase system repressor [Anaerococcus prevotii]
MLKEERQDLILKELKKNGIIRVSEITDLLDFTEMTIRRDLKELEDKKLLVRIHGGAKCLDDLSEKESSHEEKLKINRDSKLIIAKKVADLIEDGDTVFIGPGSTLELVANYLSFKQCKIVTNSYYLFKKIYRLDNIESILVGGKVRQITGAFVGSFSNSIVKSLHFKKCFIGVNGLSFNNAYTYNELEGEIQTIALDNSMHKYLVSDHTKFGKVDFFSFYNLDEINAIISDNNLKDSDKEKIEETTLIL